MEGLKEANIARETDIVLSNPVLPDEILKGAGIYLSKTWSGLALSCKQPNKNLTLFLSGCILQTCLHIVIMISGSQPFFGVGAEFQTSEYVWSCMKTLK